MPEAARAKGRRHDRIARPSKPGAARNGWLPGAGNAKAIAAGDAAEDRLGASNRVPRQMNRDLIFNQVRTRQPISRIDLARVSGLQRSTVSNIVEELIAEKWVVESAIGESPRGRKPTHLVINSRKAVVAVDIHPEQTTIALADLGGKISAERQVDLPENPGKVIAAIVRAIRETVAEHPEADVQGIGITLPGRFSRHLEKAIFAPNVAWPIAHIKSQVEKATGMVVAVDNVANACALSELWFGTIDDSRDLVVLNVSEGIGTGILVQGRLLRGSGEGAGEFGHVQVDREGIQCGCGSRGCWETTASNRAALRYYEQIAGSHEPSFNTLLESAQRGGSAALAALERMCKALGRGMHMIACALAPSEIVVVGELTRVWSFAEPIIAAELKSFPLIQRPVLRIPDDPGRARLRSAVALVMEDRRWMHRSDRAGDTATSPVRG